jgi:putative glycosyltransferase
MKISVVTTLYKSKRFLETFLQEISKTLQEINCTHYELIFVNDGSPDDSVSFLLQKKKEIYHVILVIIMPYKPVCNMQQAIMFFL